MNKLEQKLQNAIDSHTNGDLKVAEKIYSDLLKLNADDLVILHLYGILAFQVNNFTLSKNLLTKALTLKPDNDKYLDILGFLAEIAITQGDTNEALIYNKKILEIKPHDLFCNLNVGTLLLNQNDTDHAIEHYLKALYADPYCIEAYINLITAYKQKRDLDNIILCYKKLIEVNPAEPKFYFELGLMYFEKKDAENSIKYYLESIKLKQDYVESYINLADIYHKLCFFDLAIKYNLTALSINPNFVAIYNNLSGIYIDTNKSNEAIDICNQGLKLFPDSEPLKLNLARAHLLAGNIQEAWDYFKLRRIINEKKEFGPFLLDYSGSLKNKTVYVYWDAGFGDTIQFVRYIPLLRDLGAKVLFKPQAALEKLMKDSDLNVEIISDNTPVSSLKFNYQINLTCLAYLFKRKIDNFPFKDKFIKADPDKAKKYKEEFFNNTNYKVGLVWQGSNITPLHILNSISNISEFFSFAKLDNIKLYSLQKGEAENQLSNLPNDIEIVNLGSTFKDFSDTAAAIENLDLVITVDNSVAHLAGAMGKPSWVLITHVPNWRWFINRADSPWYSSMKLFRQDTPNDWKHVIDKIYITLKKELES